MERAPFQVLIFPFYRNKNNQREYAIFKRSDLGYWQGVAGGGEEGETPLQSAKRETWEETDIPRKSQFILLDSVATIPVVNVVGEFLWGDEVFVIPEYCFGVEVRSRELTLSKEHCEYKWVGYDDAMKMLKWDSNKNALWELNQRLLISRAS